MLSDFVLANTIFHPYVMARLTVEVLGPRDWDLSRFDEGRHSRKNAHAHGKTDADFLSLLHRQTSENLPWQEGQEDIHETRVYRACYVELDSDFGIQASACLGNDPILVNGVLFYASRLAWVHTRHFTRKREPSYTLQPAEQHTGGEEHIAGHQQKPDNDLGFASHQTQQGDAKRRLGPDDTDDRQRYIEEPEKTESRQVCWINGAVRPSKAQSDVCARDRVAGDETTLGNTMSARWALVF